MATSPKPTPVVSVEKAIRALNHAADLLFGAKTSAVMGDGPDAARWADALTGVIARIENEVTILNRDLLGGHL